MKYFLIIIVSFLMFTLLPKSATAQTFEFKTYDTSVGLPDNFIYALTQGANGYIWVATSEGLARYDGREFENFTVKDSLAENFVQSLFVDSKGVLWIGHNEGHISYLKDHVFHKLPNTDGSQPISDICEDSKGNIWFIDQKTGLHKISENNKPIHINYNWRKRGHRIRFYSMMSMSSKEFLIGASNGLYLIVLDNNDEIATV
jgi:ligand-binding sensor domain-containing protein